MGFSTPVVIGKVIGRFFKLRTARYAKAWASIASLDQAEGFGQNKKSFRSSDFGGGGAKRMREKFGQSLSIDLALSSRGAVPVEGEAEALRHQIIEKRIARSGIAGNRLLSRRDKT